MVLDWSSADELEAWNAFVRVPTAHLGDGVAPCCLRGVHGGHSPLAITQFPSLDQIHWGPDFERAFQLEAFAVLSGLVPRIVLKGDASAIWGAVVRRGAPRPRASGAHLSMVIALL